jgi:hypothetical protein
LLELSGTALARAGDRLDDAFDYLAARGYRGFRFEPNVGLAPVTARADGDFWFIPADDPARDKHRPLPGSRSALVGLSSATDERLERPQ